MSEENHETEEIVPQEVEPTPPPTRYISDSVEIDYDKNQEQSILTEQEE